MLLSSHGVRGSLKEVKFLSLERPLNKQEVTEKVGIMNLGSGVMV